ncbi:MAG: hypothetical protein HEQ32_04430 [Vampirovibrio sp.]
MHDTQVGGAKFDKKMEGSEFFKNNRSEEPPIFVETSQLKKPPYGGDGLKSFFVQGGKKTQVKNSKLGPFSKLRAFFKI